MDKEFELKLTLKQLQYIGDVLSEKPFKEVAILINEINEQINKQENN